MAAVIELHTGDRLLGAPSPSRSRLRLIQGGGADPGHRPERVAARGHEVSPGTYLRRRAVAAVVVLVAVVLAAQLLATGGRALAGALDRPPAASGQVHVVQPGDTAWAIAARYAPGLDRRVAVEDLLALNGRTALHPGEELQLPTSFG